MDLRVHRNDEPYWIGKPNIANIGIGEEINPYMKSENIAPDHKECIVCSEKAGSECFYVVRLLHSLKFISINLQLNSSEKEKAVQRNDYLQSHYRCEVSLIMAIGRDTAICEPLSEQVSGGIHSGAGDWVREKASQIVCSHGESIMSLPQPPKSALALDQLELWCFPPAAEPVRIEVEVDHSLFGAARENPQFGSESFSAGTKRKTRTKCNCFECNPDFAGNPTPTPNVFQCTICQKCFTKCKYFRRHMGLHGKTKTLKCDLCQVSFMFSYQLQSHRLTHTHGQKPFQCNVCRKSFTSKYYLKQHEWVHNPITPFKCRVCGKGYSSEGYFKRHELSHAQ